MILDEFFKPKPAAVLAEDSNDIGYSGAEELSVGDPVIITGNGLEFEGATGEISDFDRQKRFVVVDLYNHGPHSFHSSDVSFNEYAGSDEEEARMYDAGEFRDDMDEQGVSEGSDESDSYRAAFVAGEMEHARGKGQTYQFKPEEDNPQFKSLATKYLQQYGQQGIANGSNEKLSLFQRVFPNAQSIQQAQDSIQQRMTKAGKDSPAIKYLNNAHNILSLMYSNPTEKLASEFYNNIRQARDVEQQGMAEAKADPTGSWVVYNGSKVTRFKTHSGAKAYAEKNGGQVASSEYYHDKIQKQGVAEGSDRIAANKQDRLQALENKLKAKGYTRTKDSDGGEYQYRWTRDGAPSYVVNYRSGANGYAEFRKEQGVSEGHGNYAGDRPVNLGGVSMKKIQIGDTVRYIDQKAQVVDMSRDREHARITIPSSATTKTVLTSDLRQLGRGVLEGNDQQLSVQQLATISDEALDNAYGYGRSSPGNTFGWQANLKSAAYAKQMIDRGATDIEAISDAIHQGWNTTAKAFVQNPEQFDDTEKLRAAGKLEAKLQQRAKLMNIDYDQLPDDEQEKDRVVARALLQALTGRQDMAEAGYDSGDYFNDRQSDDYGRDLVPTGSGGSRFVNHGAHDHTRGRPAKTHGLSKNLPADPFGRTAGKIPHSARPKQELDPFRELDELSPATLARYKTKAGAAATAADSAGDRKTGDRRFSGIVKATKKQFDQDAKQSAQAVHESRLRLMASIIKTQ